MSGVNHDRVSMLSDDADVSRSRCMKEGTVAEIGTHNELMEKGGEYAKLYKVQAEAFLP